MIVFLFQTYLQFMYIHLDNKDIAQYTHSVFMIKLSHAVYKKCRVTA